MPSEFPLAKLMPPLFLVGHAELVPEARYVAFVNFGGLFLTVEAPCGCKMHYDTTSVAFEAQKSSCLEPCQSESCGFEYSLAEAAATKALKDFVSHDSDYELGGEGG